MSVREIRFWGCICLYSKKDICGVDKYPVFLPFGMVFFGNAKESVAEDPHPGLSGTRITLYDRYPGIGMADTMNFNVALPNSTVTSLVL